MRDREQFLARRRQGIGGSDAAAICGVHPYATAMDVWLEKTGRVEADEGNAATERGEALEPTILNWYRGKYLTPGDGVMLRNPFTKAHTDHAWMLANPDALVHRLQAPGEAGNLRIPGSLSHGVEAKSAFGAIVRQFGAEDSDEVPEHYLLQCQHYMAVFGVERWDLAAFLGDAHRGEFRRFILPRDEAIIAHLIEVEGRFWRDHVLADVPPEPSNTADRAALNRALYPASVRPMIEADANARAIMAAYLEADLAAEAAKAQRADCRARIETIIGANYGIRADGLGTITWASKNERTRVFRARWSNGGGE